MFDHINKMLQWLVISFITCSVYKKYIRKSFRKEESQIFLRQKLNWNVCDRRHRKDRFFLRCRKLYWNI